MRIKFYKTVALGNDFIVINNLKNKITELSGLSKHLCKPKYCIGADGVLFIEKSAIKGCNFKMRIFNSDGSEAEMCGNGARCIAYVAYKKEHVAPKSMYFETLAGVIHAVVKEKSGEKDICTVRIQLSEPKDIKLCLKIKNANLKRILKLRDNGLLIHYINVGVPHAIILVDDLGSVNVPKVGREIRFDKMFSPQGTNVDFVKVVEEHTLYVRTYERGVENETYSCGTGAVASAIITSLLHKTAPPVKVIPYYNREELVVSYKVESAGKVSNVSLEGKAKIVFEGYIEV
jgi:diaminopimelate epimerase